MVFGEASILSVPLVSVNRSAPIGVLSLVAASIADLQNLEAIFTQLGIFVAAVTVGIIIQQLIVFPIMYFVFTRTNPFKAYLKMMKAWFIAFASASSYVI